jgi:uncharacterized tellurite resistance protein B-like protein
MLFEDQVFIIVKPDGLLHIQDLAAMVVSCFNGQVAATSEGESGFVLRVAKQLPEVSRSDDAVGRVSSFQRLQVLSVLVLGIIGGIVARRGKFFWRYNLRMLTHADNLALLKVLLSAAWADSKLTQTEINYIKVLAKRFQLKDSDWLELEPYLEDPPSDSETKALFQDLLERFPTPAARAEVVTHLEAMMNADSQITAEEHDFLEQYSLILKHASTVELLVMRMKGLFVKTKTLPPLDLEEFLNNKILFKLRRKLGVESITPDMHRLCLLGGLMGIVAQADGVIDDREIDEIRRRLQVRGRFDAPALELLLTIIQEETVRGLDRARLVRDYTAGVSFDERVELLDLLFAVAAADDKLTHAELEELRGLSAAMLLSHKQYIDAKLRLKSSVG